MTKKKLPAAGGSYVRKKDGSLTRTPVANPPADAKATNTSQAAPQVAQAKSKQSTKKEG